MTQYQLRARHLPDGPLVVVDRGDRTWCRMRFSLLQTRHSYLEIVDAAGVVLQRGGAWALAHPQPERRTLAQTLAATVRGVLRRRAG